MGITTFGTGITLLSDRSARGHFDCVDHHGDAPGYPGTVFGEVTSWSIDGGGIVSLNVIGKLVVFPGGLVLTDLPFTIKIQRFGGAGVGHWTLDAFGFTICFETLLSGQIVIH